MISTNDFRPGLTVEMDGEILQVLESQHVKPGKGPAFVRARLKNLMTGTITQQTLRSGEKVPAAHLEKRRMQYLYRDGDMFYFMDTETFEQTALSEEQLGEAVKWLRENTEVRVLTFKDEMVGVDLPTSVVLEVTDTVPGLKGDTVTGGTKEATVETGATVSVPLFINEGDKVRIDTRTGEYTERVESRD